MSDCQPIMVRIDYNAQTSGRSYHVDFWPEESMIDLVYLHEVKAGKTSFAIIEGDILTFKMTNGGAVYRIEHDQRHPDMISIPITLVEILTP
jgi:hypothetical protein